MKMKVKLIIGAIILLIVIGLSIALGVTAHRVKSLKQQNTELIQGQASWIKNLQAKDNEIYQYKMTIDGLRMLQDSTMIELRALQKKLKIKNKELQGLQSMQSTFLKTDTLIFKDTVFIEEDFCADTTIGDEWMNTRLYVEWPSTILLKSTVESKKNVIIYLKKETIEEPKKCWIARLFQKKQKVVKVYIDELNPYINDQENMFIEVVK